MKLANSNRRNLCKRGDLPTSGLPLFFARSLIVAQRVNPDLSGVKCAGAAHELCGAIKAQSPRPLVEFDGCAMMLLAMVVTSRCECASFRAINRTFDTYPQRWYERNLGQYLAGVGTCVVLLWISGGRGLTRDIWVSVSAGVVYLVGVAADIGVTLYTQRIKTEFEKRELPCPVVETHPDLPDHPTLGQMLTGKSLLTILLLMPLVLLVPLYSVGMLVARLCVVANNLRYHQRARLALKLLDEGVIR